jgi:hypothetical protein
MWLMTDNWISMRPWQYVGTHSNSLEIHPDSQRSLYTDFVAVRPFQRR